MRATEEQRGGRAPTPQLLMHVRPAQAAIRNRRKEEAVSGDEEEEGLASLNGQLVSILYQVVTI